MIKNFKLYNKPKSTMKLCTTVLAGALILGSLSACSNTENAKIFGQLPDSQQTETVPTNITKIFAPGEHIISIPIDNPTKDVKQYEYYPGYKCLGMSTSAYGRSFNSFAGACLLYTNEVEVECPSLNGITFTEFGIPLNYEKEETTILSDGTKNFGIGEHIISIPIDNPNNANVQYQFYEGYEALDIAVSAYDGGAILYSNIVPVSCSPTAIEDNKYQYLTFGKPIEPEETMVLTK